MTITTITRRRRRRRRRSGEKTTVEREDNEGVGKNWEAEEEELQAE